MSAFLVDVIAGALSGLAVTFVGHPFETIKVRLQTQPSPPNHLYNGFTDCVKKTLAWEGPGGLYKGVSSPLVGQLFFRSLMFQVNGWYIRTFQPQSYVSYAVGGAVTWFAATAIECPLQVISSQMQVAILRAKTDPTTPPEFKSVSDYVRRAPAKYGLRALYRGVVPQLIRNCGGGLFHFGAFEAIRREVAKSRGVPVTEVGLGINMLAGGIGGVLFWTSTYPVDVIKSALQGDYMDKGKAKYTGAMDAARKLWAEGGAERFTRGYSAALARSVPANAALLTTAMMCKEYGYKKLGIHTGAPPAAPSAAAAAAAGANGKALA